MLSPQVFGFVCIISDAISTLEEQAEGFVSVESIEKYLNRKYNIQTYDSRSCVVDFLLDHPDRFIVSKDLKECCCIKH